MTLKEKWRELHGKGLEPGVYKYDGKPEAAPFPSAGGLGEPRVIAGGRLGSTSYS